MDNSKEATVSATGSQGGYDHTDNAQEGHTMNAVAQLRTDLENDLGNIKGWVEATIEKRLPAIDEAAAKLDKAASNPLVAALLDSGVIVPARYVDIALNLLGDLAKLDEKPAETAPATPAEPAAA